MAENPEVKDKFVFDTTNKQLVGVQGDDIVIVLAKNRMTKAEALVHAAFIVALADEKDEFDSILKQVQNT